MTYTDRFAADTFGRRFTYLRLSVTEICNFRCTYCLPDGFKKSGPMDFLSGEEVSRVVRAFAGLGVSKVRLTGGEPTVRGDLTSLIARVSAEPGIEKVALTTNGWNLKKHIAEWSEAGLTHLNLSIDALDREAFARITGYDRYDDIMAGLDIAQTLPLKALKINAVLLKDGLIDDFAPWTDFVADRDVSVRFIELMRTGDNGAFFEDQHVSGEVLRRWLTLRGWAPTARGVDDGPATEFSHPDYRGRIGLIAPYAPGFCDSCNRLRITARGLMRLCLFGQSGVPLRPLLRSDSQTTELQDRIVQSLGAKTIGHALHAADPGDIRNLAQTGG